MAHSHLPSTTGVTARMHWEQAPSRAHSEPDTLRAVQPPVLPRRVPTPLHPTPLHPAPYTPAPYTPAPYTPAPYTPAPQPFTPLCLLPPFSSACLPHAAPVAPIIPGAFWFEVLGLRIQGLGVWGLGLGVWGVGCGVWVVGFEDERFRGPGSWGW